MASSTLKAIIVSLHDTLRQSLDEERYRVSYYACHSHSSDKHGFQRWSDDETTTDDDREVWVQYRNRKPYLRMGFVIDGDSLSITIKPIGKYYQGDKHILIDLNSPEELETLETNFPNAVKSYLTYGLLGRERQTA